MPPGDTKYSLVISITPLRQPEPRTLILPDSPMLCNFIYNPKNRLTRRTMRGYTYVYKPWMGVVTDWDLGNRSCMDVNVTTLE
jgi:hypothetical protein